MQEIETVWKSEVLETPVLSVYTVVLFNCIRRIRAHGVNICVISGIRIGFKYSEMGKGLYAEELNELLAVVINQGDTVSSIAITNGSVQIRKMILAVGKTIEE